LLVTSKFYYTFYYISTNVFSVQKLQNFTPITVEMIQSGRMSWVWNVVRMAEITACTFYIPKAEAARPPWKHRRRWWIIWTFIL